MTFHIEIAQERRTEPERMAQSIRQAVATGKMVDDMPEYVAGPEQLHLLGTATEIYDGRIKAATKAGNDALALELTIAMANGETPDFSNPQFVMVVEWDGESKYVIKHKGDYSKRNLSYAGWPDITKEEWDALPVADIGL